MGWELPDCPTPWPQAGRDPQLPQPGEGQAGQGMSSPCFTPSGWANLGKGLTLLQPQFPHCLPAAHLLWGSEVRVWIELEGKPRPERVRLAGGFGIGSRIPVEGAPVSTTLSCRAGVRGGGRRLTPAPLRRPCVLDEQSSPVTSLGKSRLPQGTCLLRVTQQIGQGVSPAALLQNWLSCVGCMGQGHVQALCRMPTH